MRSIVAIPGVASQRGGPARPPRVAPAAGASDTASTMQIAYLDGPRLRRSLIAACEHAQQQRAELNRINVFPVPDGDTGTNLALTLRSIADHLRDNRDPAPAGVAGVAAEAAVLGARGNSGMMLSHFLLGFAEQLSGRVRLSAREFASALRAGVERLQDALEEPVEGTILTVMRDTAHAATEADESDFVPLVELLVRRARASLARTPELLPTLRAAGVVDAGAKGFVALLEGVLHLIHGDPGVPGGPGDPPAGAPDPLGAVAYPAERETHRFCTEALVRGEGLPSRDVVQERLRPWGDSLVVIRTGSMLKVHLHTDEPDAVFALLRTMGTLVTHKAEDMQAQHAVLERGARAGHRSLARRPVAIVTDSGADLPDEVVRAHGIHVTPLELVDGDRSLRDGVDITAADFHHHLAESPETLPTTSQPPPAAFLEHYTRAAEEGQEVIAVLLGSALSGTFASGEAAARSFTGAPLHLVDSRGASLLQGLLVLKAAELAEAGTPPDAIAAEVRRIRARSGILFTVDTFERLLRSGRVGRGRAFLGSLMNVKPVLALDPEGRVAVEGRVIGRERVKTALVDAVAARVPAGTRGVRFGIVHVGVPEIVAEVEALLRGRFGEREILSAPATPVLSTHLGIGAWGVAFMVED